MPSPERPRMAAITVAAASLLVFAVGTAALVVAIGASGRPRTAGATFAIASPSPTYPPVSSAFTPTLPPSVMPIATSTPRPFRSPSASATVLGWHVPILMYHRFGTGPESLLDPSLWVPPGLFADQMAALHGAGWTTITAANLAYDLAIGRHPPRKTFVVTIDDGYEDGWAEAFPILQSDGFVATYYVVTGRIGAAAALQEGQVVALAEAGMEIADHTVHHVGLAIVPSATAVTEIDKAAAWIAAVTGIPPSTLAYPFGNEDTAVVADVRAAGFAMAVTTEEGCFESTADRLLVPRLRVGPGTMPAVLLAEVRGCGYP